MFGILAFVLLCFVLVFVCFNFYLLPSIKQIRDMRQDIIARNFVQVMSVDDHLLEIRAKTLEQLKAVELSCRKKVGLYRKNISNDFQKFQVELAKEINMLQEQRSEELSSYLYELSCLKDQVAREVEPLILDAFNY